MAVIVPVIDGVGGVNDVIVHLLQLRVVGLEMCEHAQNASHLLSDQFVVSMVVGADETGPNFENTGEFFKVTDGCKQNEIHVLNDLVNFGCITHCNDIMVLAVYTKLFDENKIQANLRYL